MIQKSSRSRREMRSRPETSEAVSDEGEEPRPRSMRKTGKKGRVSVEAVKAGSPRQVRFEEQEDTRESVAAPNGAGERRGRLTGWCRRRRGDEEACQAKDGGDGGVDEQPEAGVGGDDDEGGREDLADELAEDDGCKR